MELQVPVIFTSLQNAKFTSVAGCTSLRPTYIESFRTIFGQCINVLSYNNVYPQFTYNLLLHMNTIIGNHMCELQINISEICDPPLRMNMTTHGTTVCKITLFLVFSDQTWICIHQIPLANFFDRLG